jgi:hypothetical protein
MSTDQNDSISTPDEDDVEGHGLHPNLRPRVTEDEDDVEGHGLHPNLRPRVDADEEDDVAGHVSPRNKL